MYSEKDKNWILGYLEAKGCFTFNRVTVKNHFYLNPVFFVTHREKEPLFLLKEVTGLGKVRRGKGMYRWEVRKKREVMELMEFLEGGLRTPTKVRQYLRWREEVLQWKQRGRS